MKKTAIGLNETTIHRCYASDDFYRWDGAPNMFTTSSVAGSYASDHSKWKTATVPSGTWLAYRGVLEAGGGYIYYDSARSDYVVSVEFRTVSPGQGADDTATVIFMLEDADNFASVGIDSDGKMFINKVTGGIKERYFSSDLQYDTDAWHCVAVRVSNAVQFSIYIDGEFVFYDSFKSIDVPTYAGLGAIGCGAYFSRFAEFSYTSEYADWVSTNLTVNDTSETIAGNVTAIPGRWGGLVQSGRPMGVKRNLSGVSIQNPDSINKGQNVTTQVIGQSPKSRLRPGYRDVLSIPNGDDTNSTYSNTKVLTFGGSSTDTIYIRLVNEFGTDGGDTVYVNCSADFSDIVFTDTDLNTIPHYINSIQGGTALVFIMPNQPLVPGDKILLHYCGNSTTINRASVVPLRETSSGQFNDTLLGAWRMDEYGGDENKITDRVADNDATVSPIETFELRPARASDLTLTGFTASDADKYVELTSDGATTSNAASVSVTTSSNAPIRITFKCDKNYSDFTQARLYIEDSTTATAYWNLVFGPEDITTYDFYPSSPDVGSVDVTDVTTLYFDFQASEAESFKVRIYDIIWGRAPAPGLFQYRGTFFNGLTSSRLMLSAPGPGDAWTNVPVRVTLHANGGTSYGNDIYNVVSNYEWRDILFTDYKYDVVSFTLIESDADSAVFLVWIPEIDSTDGAVLNLHFDGDTSMDHTNTISSSCVVDSDNVFDMQSGYSQNYAPPVSMPSRITYPGTVRTVAASGAAFTTVPAAINAASAGDVIDVWDAQTTESEITINKNLSFVSSTGLGSIERTSGTNDEYALNIVSGTNVQFNGVDLKSSVTRGMLAYGTLFWDSGDITITSTPNLMLAGGASTRVVFSGGTHTGYLLPQAGKLWVLGGSFVSHSPIAASSNGTVVIDGADYQNTAPAIVSQQGVDGTVYVLSYTSTSASQTASVGLGTTYIYPTVQNYGTLTLSGDNYVNVMADSLLNTNGSPSWLYPNSEFPAVPEPPAPYVYTNPTLGRNIIVDALGGGDYTTLADAVANAQDGDVLEIVGEQIVNDLPYFNINKKIHLTSDGSGIVSKTIAGSGTYVFRIASDYVKITNLTINGMNAGVYVPYTGSGLWLEDSVINSRYSLYVDRGTAVSKNNSIMDSHVIRDGRIFFDGSLNILSGGYSFICNTSNIVVMNATLSGVAKPLINDGVLYQLSPSSYDLTTSTDSVAYVYPDAGLGTITGTGTVYVATTPGDAVGSGVAGDGTSFKEAYGQYVQTDITAGYVYTYDGVNLHEDFALPSMPSDLTPDAYGGDTYVVNGTDAPDLASMPPLPEPPTFDGATIVVNTDGTGDYITIQEAVTAASAGDIVQVNGGTYDESVAVDKDLKIEGTDTVSVTAMTFSHGDTEISGLTTDLTVNGDAIVRDVGNNIDAVNITGFGILVGDTETYGDVSVTKPGTLIGQALTTGNVTTDNMVPEPPAPYVYDNPSLGRNIVVNADGTGDFEDFSSAQAEATDGDVIEVQDAQTYSGQKTIEYSISLVGNGSLTRIDGGTSDYAIVINSGKTVNFNLNISSMNGRVCSNSGTLFINGGNYSAGHSIGFIQGINTTTVINDCNFDSSLYFHNGGGKLFVNGGTFSHSSAPCYTRGIGHTYLYGFNHTGTSTVYAIDNGSTVHVLGQLPDGATLRYGNTGVEYNAKIYVHEAGINPNYLYDDRGGQLYIPTVPGNTPTIASETLTATSLALQRDVHASVEDLNTGTIATIDESVLKADYIDASTSITASGTSSIIGGVITSPSITTNDEATITDKHFFYVHNAVTESTEHDIIDIMDEQNYDSVLQVAKSLKLTSSNGNGLLKQTDATQSAIGVSAGKVFIDCPVDSVGDGITTTGGEVIIDNTDILANGDYGLNNIGNARVDVSNSSITAPVPIHSNHADAVTMLKSDVSLSSVNEVLDCEVGEIYITDALDVNSTATAIELISSGNLFVNGDITTTQGKAINLLCDTESIFVYPALHTEAAENWNVSSMAHVASGYVSDTVPFKIGAIEPDSMATLYYAFFADERLSGLDISTIEEDLAKTDFECLGAWSNTEWPYGLGSISVHGRGTMFFNTGFSQEATFNLATGLGGQSIWIVAVLRTISTYIPTEADDSLFGFGNINVYSDDSNTIITAPDTTVLATPIYDGLTHTVAIQFVPGQSITAYIDGGDGVTQSTTMTDISTVPTGFFGGDASSVQFFMLYGSGEPGKSVLDSVAEQLMDTADIPVLSVEPYGLPPAVGIRSNFNDFLRYHGGDCLYVLYPGGGFAGQITNVAYPSYDKRSGFGLARFSMEMVELNMNGVDE